MFEDGFYSIPHFLVHGQMHNETREVLRPKPAEEILLHCKPKSEKKRFIYSEKPQKYFFRQEYYNKISVLYLYSKNQVPADFLENNSILQNNNRENLSPSRVFRSRTVDSTPSQLKLYLLLRSTV